MQTSALERGDMFCENREKMGGVCNCMGGGFKYFIFSPLFAEDFQFD